MLRCVSRTSLSTKLAPHLVEQLTDIVTDAVLTIQQPDQPLDLYMVRGGSSGSCTNHRPAPLPQLAAWAHHCCCCRRVLPPLAHRLSSETHAMLPANHMRVHME
jgi:hypothetical protein